jgi:hypothetical protein
VEILASSCSLWPHNACVHADALLVTLQWDAATAVVAVVWCTCITKSRFMACCPHLGFVPMLQQCGLAGQGMDAVHICTIELGLKLYRKPEAQVLCCIVGTVLYPCLG